MCSDRATHSSRKRAQKEAAMRAVAKEVVYIHLHIHTVKILAFFSFTFSVWCEMNNAFFVLSKK